MNAPKVADYLLPKEKDFQSQVVELATVCGWLHYHTFNSKHSAPGFPDLLLMRGERCLVVELKSAKGQLTAEQQKWLDAFRRLKHIEVFVWRPCDWDEVVRTLTPGPAGEQNAEAVKHGQ